MDEQQQTLQVFSRKEIKFKKRLEKVLHSENLNLQRELIKKIVQESNIELLDCAAALVCLSQANLYRAEENTEVKNSIALYPKRLRKIPPPKMLRYRLEVGKKHNVSVEEIKNIVVREAGVDQKMIGDVSIYFQHTFIELPEGMPADIFQLLSTTTLHKQALKIKRLYPHKKHKRKNNKHVG